MKNVTQGMFDFFAMVIDWRPEVWCEVAMRVDDKIYLYCDGGVVIYPKDKSYRRFIANSWYDNVDTESL